MTNLGELTDREKVFLEQARIELDCAYRYRKALLLCAAQAGLPDAGDACREILKTIHEALEWS